MSQKIRILIIDDMKSARKALRSHLKERGYEDVLEAESALPAREMLDAQKKAGAPVDLIFCDWNMPGKSGITLLQELRSTAEYRAVPVIMFTSEAEFNQVKEAIASGATNYLVKPYQPETLYEKLDYIVEKYRLGRGKH